MEVSILLKEIRIFTVRFAVEYLIYIFDSEVCELSRLIFLNSYSISLPVSLACRKASSISANFCHIFFSPLVYYYSISPLFLSTLILRILRPPLWSRTQSLHDFITVNHVFPILRDFFTVSIANLYKSFFPPFRGLPHLHFARVSFGQPFRSFLRQ